MKDVGWSDWKVEIDTSSISEALKEVAEAVAQAWGRVSKALTPTIEFVNKIAFEYFDDHLPEKKKIYQAEYRMKSNMKNYGYKQNYRKRMFCVGNRGNFRRF
ncbi:hypothetical protein [Acetobacterium sp.]|uniref:hypothetical protein n=1 Tax=Acetobacterium sp. TaxID=1872094 RepID=UPI002727AD1F|nr:hypothetical protein [Acetobacterium sp.]MDO9492817.1 hypothetical protein [Acetobacterium sp.]